MKAKLYIKLLGGVLLILIASACTSQPKKLKPIIPYSLDPLEKNLDKGKVLGFLVEDRILTHVVEVPPLVAEESIENTPSYLKINTVSLPLQAAEIDTNAINMLRGIADTLTCLSACTRSILGLRITYGAVGNSLVLYYQPLLLCYIQTAGIGGGIGEHNNYSLCKEGINYVYTVGGSFTPANVTDMNLAISKYAAPKTGLGIRRTSGSSTFDNFSAINSIFGDATSLVFSFQQIKNVFKKPGSPPTVKIWNTLGVIPLDPITRYPDPLLKHLLLISPGDVTFSGNDLIVNGQQFSNLSHICPPDCSGSSFWFITAPHP